MTLSHYYPAGLEH